jgi:hypothetical protein
MPPETFRKRFFKRLRESGLEVLRTKMGKGAIREHGFILPTIDTIAKKFPFLAENSLDILDNLP